MDLASQDAELRAALFRFVDVVPACRSLDDLARHLSGFLDEVDDRPPSLQVAMRMSDSRAGRQALGAAAAAGVKHMAHRFIVGETPREATGVLEELWKHGVATSRRPARRGDRHERRGRPLRRQRCREALDGLADVYRKLPDRPALEADSAGRDPAREPVGQGLARSPRCCGPTRPSSASATRPRACATCCAARASSAPTCTSTWSPSTRARRSPTSSSSCSPRTSSATARPPASSCRPTCATRPQLCERDRRLGAAHPARPSPLLVRLVKGAYWDHEIVEARQHGWDAAGVRGQGRLRPQLRGAHARACSTRGRRVRVADRRATTCARSRTRSPPAARMGARRRATSSSRSCAASATTSRTRSPRAGCACARTARSATSSPAWPTWCAGCWRTRATSPSCTSRPAGRSLDELLAAP